MTDFNSDDYLFNYLSYEDKKRIAEQVWRERLEAKFKSDNERIVSNAAYDIVREMCESIVPNFNELLTEKVKGVITKLSTHTVFSPPDAWDRKATVGWTMMNEVVLDKRQRLENRVEKIIDELEPRVDWNLDIDYEIRQLLLKRLGWGE
jgi:hypothetical protein